MGSTKLRIPHYLAICEGQITVLFAGRPTTDRGAAYDEEDNAIADLAQAMIDSQCVRILTSSTCNWPADDGRPGFKIDAFLERLKRRVDQIQAA